MQAILKKLRIKQQNFGASTGQKSWSGGGKKLISYSPIDGAEIASTRLISVSDYEKVMQQAQMAYQSWRMLPAPRRGEIVRLMGDEFRKNKFALGQLVSLEMGKSLQEGLGEVQEIIDICDFAVGLSRQLYGLTMHSERPNHRMYEQWHPLGVVGVISAFNFPVAVWSWNAMLAFVCGNVCVWKPSEKTPLTAIACQNIIQKVLADNDLPEGISSVIIGDKMIGERMSKDARIPLISATGSTKMGKAVAVEVAKRLGKSLLELGGNNAIIISEFADLKLVLPAVVFGAIGTAGQRCTTTRRLIIHENKYDEVLTIIKNAYAQIKIGNPLDEVNHVGPLIDADAVNAFVEAIEKAKNEGGNVVFGGKILNDGDLANGFYVEPTIIEAENHFRIVQTETFVPILYVMKFKTIDEAIKIQNDVPQGLSSAIFTQNLAEAEAFLSVKGSDCGIANVNIGTSGAEIGGAFGGEKETGGGRESGSDAWKVYMRRQTNTINYGTNLPLAQGIKFDF
jgi:aldehyde dehydrogenase (NAD+)